MLVIDASALFEVVADTPRSEVIRGTFLQTDGMAAPQLIDAEVLSVIQHQSRAGALDETAATQAVSDLGSWPGERWSHRPFLERAWELRYNVRAYDALYVALAEALHAPLITLDSRLAASPGLRCDVIIPD